jgi:hypothetical protein
MSKHICAECEEKFILVNGVPHHADDESPDGIDHEMDAHHIPYSSTEAGNVTTCTCCGGERTCNEDGNLAIGETCPVCGYLEVDHESLRGAGLAFSGYGR